MGKEAPWIVLFSICCFLTAVILVHPQLLSDSGNSFLKDFLDNDILSVLGFVTAVGNAATLSIFLHLNNLEDQTIAKFSRTRTSLKKSASTLIYVFLVTFVVLIIKPIAADGLRWEAFFNSVGIVCVYISLSVLRDLTLTVFAIPTIKRIEDIKRKNEGKE